MKASKVMICCHEDEKEFFESKAKNLYMDMIILTDKIEDKPDKLFVVQTVDDKMQHEIDEAIKREIPVYYMTEDFVWVKLYEYLLK